MKTHTLLLVVGIMLVSTSGNAQEIIQAAAPTPTDANVLSPVAIAQANAPKDGVLRNYFPNGALQSEHFPDTGLTKIYYQDGKLAFEGHFKNLVDAEGVHKFYFADGTLQHEQKWQAGKLLGKNNKPFTGTEKIYFQNGKIKEEIEFKKGERSGHQRSYYESGKIRVDAEYQKQTIVKGKSYYETGELASEAKTINGKIEVKRFDKQGKQILTPAADAENKT